MWTIYFSVGSLHWRQVLRSFSVLDHISFYIDGCSVMWLVSLQGSQPPVETVWTLFRTTILHTGSSPFRHSQRWTHRPSPPHTAPPSGHSYHTEPAGCLTQPTAAIFTPLPQASRLSSDPQLRPRQTCYRVPLSTATRDCQHSPTQALPTVKRHSTKAAAIQIIINK